MAASRLPTNIGCLALQSPLPVPGQPVLATSRPTMDLTSGVVGKIIRVRIIPTATCTISHHYRPLPRLPSDIHRFGA